MPVTANPETNRKITRSVLATLVISLLGFYAGNRYGSLLAGMEGAVFNNWETALHLLPKAISQQPLYLDKAKLPLFIGTVMTILIWLIWLRYIAFAGHYRTGEESGSARWGTKKEGTRFKDRSNPDNNLIFTENYGLALHRPRFDPELDRNLNVLVVGGSGSGKTFNYVTPNICQLNANYFITDPKGTLLPAAGYLFTENGYRVKSFNTINFSESMHYNPPSGPIQTFSPL